MVAIVTALNWGPGGEATSDRESDPDPVAPAPTSTPEDQAQAEKKQALDAAIYRNLVQERERLTSKSEIATQLEELERTVEPYEYAARLCALGNLYQQKHGDYATAAGYYELLIDDYPDWPGIASAYHQLITCYKQLDQILALRLLYKKIMVNFPEGSAEYEYAKVSLEE